MATNNDRGELRERLNDLRTAADALDALLANGRRLPAFVLARCALDLDAAARKLQRHAKALTAKAEGS